MWTIRKIEGPYTCTVARISQDHLKLDTKIVCNCIMPLVKEMPTILVSVLIVDMQARFKYRVSDRKVWWVMEQLYGDWDASYNELKGWIVAMREYVSGYELESQQFRQRFTRLEAQMMGLQTNLRQWLGRMEHWQWTQIFSTTFYKLVVLMPRIGLRQVKQIKTGYVHVEAIQKAMAVNARRAQKMNA
ncbi:hypothetical protein GOBAR_DD13870 [Gossypium barbadense]|nr:hypothetical protein GOBAR_DD13870 [Gossypium barbadense]